MKNTEKRCSHYLEINFSEWLPWIGFSWDQQSFRLSLPSSSDRHWCLWSWNCPPVWSTVLRWLCLRLVSRNHKLQSSLKGCRHHSCLIKSNLTDVFPRVPPLYAASRQGKGKSMVKYHSICTDIQAQDVHHILSLYALPFALKCISLHERIDVWIRFNSPLLLHSTQLLEFTYMDDGTPVLRSILTMDLSRATAWSDPLKQTCKQTLRALQRSCMLRIRKSRGLNM